MVLCRKNRPCGLKFGGGSGGGGGGSGSSSGGQVATSAAVAAQLPAVSCSQEAQMASAQGYSNGISGNGLHEFHGKLQQHVQLYSDCDGAAPVETAQLPNVGPTRVLDHLYIGSQADSLDGDVMRRSGITHVLNVSIACPQSQHVPENNFLRIPVNDGYTDKLLPHFNRAFNFLEIVRKTGGRCLVHCLAGISRSPTLSIAYIMMLRRMSQEDAYRFVKQRRQHISPNFNFLGQLVEFERQLKRGSGVGALLASAQPSAAEDRGRPDTKRQRTCPGSPTVPQPEFGGGILGRPRSVLLVPASQVGSDDGSDVLSVRRSRSSDTFLMEVDAECDPRSQEPGTGAVACPS